MFVFWRITLFCLGYRFSKHKITVCSKNFFGEGHDAVGPPGYAYALASFSDELAVHSCSFLCLQRQVVKLANRLFYVWSLLRNNTAANLQITRSLQVAVVVLSGSSLSACMVTVKRRHLGR